ncbi:MAG: hypothetical protein V4459_08775 [Pseudomonadota bacterium]
MRKTLGIVAVVVAAFGAGPVLADNAMKVCGAKYQTAKTAKTLPAGQTWAQFLKACRASLTPAPATAAKAPAGGLPSAAQTAMRARQRQCAAQWKADKTAGKVPAGQTWPQYWSACNKRAA